MSDELLKRLETGHDKECAMSYGMHEHCCDCSYPARQEAAARVRELEAERDALRADAERYRWLRNNTHSLSLLPVWASPNALYNDDSPAIWDQVIDAALAGEKP